MLSVGPLILRLFFFCMLSLSYSLATTRFVPHFAVFWTGHRKASSFLRPPPSLSNPPTPSESTSAREWLFSFRQASIPRDQVELTFSRSSGPGGQNVNKVNTKTTVRCSLDKEWIPTWARDDLMKTPAYISSSRSLLVTSTQFRSQSQNIEDCFTKLHALVHSAGHSAIPTPADPKRMARKAGYERAAKERRKTGKINRAAVKGGRKGGGVSWD